MTYILDGAFHHGDNLEKDSIVSADSPRYFSAGKGIRYSKLPDSPCMIHGLKLWINLPHRLKNIKQDYQQERQYAFPERRIKGVYIHTIVCKRSHIQTHKPICYLDITLGGVAVLEEKINQRMPVGAPETSVIINISLDMIQQLYRRILC